MRWLLNKYLLLPGAFFPPGGMGVVAASSHLLGPLFCIFVWFLGTITRDSASSIPPANAPLVVP